MLQIQQDGDDGDRKKSKIISLNEHVVNSKPASVVAEEEKLPILYSEETLEHELIDPEQAQSYLDFAATNRFVARADVLKYAKEMKEERWIASSDSIKFDIYGRLCDGQHRLSAVIASGIPQMFAVRRGLSEEAMAVLDIGKVRSALDTAKIKGIANINHRHTAATNALSLPYEIRVGSKSQITDTFQKFEPAIRFVIDRPKSVGNTPILCVVSAVIIKAYYYEDHAKLDRFIDVLSSGFATGEHEWAAIALRSSIKDNKELNMSVNYRKSLFLKAQNALKQFLLGNKIRQIKTTAAVRDDYPIPGFCKPADKKKAISHFEALSK